MRTATATEIANPMQLNLFGGHEYPKTPFTYGSQSWRLYERLKEGPITNIEIIRSMNIVNSTGRASEVREFLEKNGYQLIAQAKGGGVYEYRISKTDI